MSSGRPAKTVGRLYSAPANRLVVEQVEQLSPVSERSTVLLGFTPCVHIEETEGNLGVPSKPSKWWWCGETLKQGVASIKQGKTVSGLP